MVDWLRIRTWVGVPTRQVTGGVLTNEDALCCGELGVILIFAVRGRGCPDEVAQVKDVFRGIRVRWASFVVVFGGCFSVVFVCGFVVVCWAGRPVVFPCAALSSVGVGLPPVSVHLMQL